MRVRTLFHRADRPQQFSLMRPRVIGASSGTYKALAKPDVELCDYSRRFAHDCSFAADERPRHFNCLIGGERLLARAVHSIEDVNI